VASFEFFPTTARTRFISVSAFHEVPKRKREVLEAYPCFIGFFDTRKGMAERVGFEPTVGFLLHTLSKRAP
jgi:hypothetical protein